MNVSDEPNKYEKVVRALEADEPPTQTTGPNWMWGEGPAKPTPEKVSALVPLLSEAEIEAMPDPRWLVEGRIPQWGHVEWFSPPEVGKTAAALDLAMHLAAPPEICPDWHGAKINARGSVCYVYTEGAAALKLRRAAWRKAHPEVTGELPIRFVPVGVNLFTGEDQKLMATLQALWPGMKPVLVVFDTLRRCSAGADENDSGDMYVITAALDRIRRWTEGATLTLAHPGLDDSRPRGTSANPDVFDVIERLSRDDTDALVFEMTKNRDGAHAPHLRLKVVPFDDSIIVVDADPETTTSANGRALTKNQRTALQVLDEIALSDGVTYTAWEKSAGLKPRTFANARKVLLSRKLILPVSDGKYAVSPNGLESLNGRHPR